MRYKAFKFMSALERTNMFFSFNYELTFVNYRCPFVLGRSRIRIKNSISLLTKLVIHKLDLDN